MFPLKIKITKTTGYFQTFHLIIIFYDLFLSYKVPRLVSNFRVHWMLLVRCMLQLGRICQII